MKGGTRKIEIRGDRPLLMTDSEKIWRIVSGQLDIFMVAMEHGEWGKREYAFSAGRGTCLPGGVVSGDALPEAGETAGPVQYALLASGSPGVKVVEVAWDDLIREISDGASEIRDGLSHWFALGDKLIGSELAAKFETLCGPGPISADELKTGLAELNREMLEQILRIQLNRLADFRERVMLRTQNNHAKMRHSFQEMVGILTRKPSTHSGHANPLVQACSLVAGACRIELKVPARLLKDATAAVTLDEISRASNFYTREVLLEARWWRNDSGSLLGYMAEDGRPVAIIAVKPQIYIVHDFQFNRRFRVNSRTARLLKPKAVMFYRPFPHRPLTIRDLFLFGCENVWKQDVITFVLIGLMGSIFGMATPKVTELLFNKVIPEGSCSQLVQLASLYFVVLVSKTLLDMTRSFALKRVEGYLESSIQAAVMDRLVKLPVSFFKQYTTGDLTSRVNAISSIRSILSGAMVNGIISGVFGSVYLIMLYLYSAQLATLALLMVMGIVIVSLLVSITNLKYVRNQQVVNNKLYGLVYELISGVPKFRTAGAEERAFHRWAIPFSKSVAITVKSGKLVNGIGVLNTAATTVFSMIFYYMIVGRKLQIELGPFIAFQSAFAIFSSSILGLMQALIDANRILPLYELAKPILETLPEYDLEKPDPGVLKGAIEVKHVNFRYQVDGPLVLKDVSLSINEGEYVGIVGASGSGKSTLLRILLGFEKPETGQVYYDGKDMSSFDIRAIRRQFGVVLQNAHVMAGSIFSNIVGSYYHLTLKDAEEALEMAGLSDDIKQMPMGIHTMVPDGGSTLSGGQRQRLVIARALVNKPKILFFDEATSALDNRTQEIVSQSLRRLRTTRIVVAHRLSTIVDCDRIIVFHEGRIVEEGTYQELMAKAGLFSELAKRQLA